MPGVAEVVGEAIEMYYTERRMLIDALGNLIKGRSHYCQPGTGQLHETKMELLLQLTNELLAPPRTTVGMPGFLKESEKQVATKLGINPDERANSLPQNLIFALGRLVRAVCWRMLALCRCVLTVHCAVTMSGGGCAVISG